VKLSGSYELILHPPQEGKREFGAVMGVMEPVCDWCTWALGRSV